MKEIHHYDEGTDTLRIQKVEDVSAVLEQNKRQFDVDNKSFKSDAFNHVARIPLSAIEQYCQLKGIKFEEFMNNEKLFKAFLNDPDNRLFRTKPGRV